MIGPLFGIAAFFVVMGLFVLAALFILVPIVRGGFALGSLVGRLVGNVFTWFFGSISDMVRIFGLLVGAIVLVPIVLGSIVLGRWTTTQQAWTVVSGNVADIAGLIYRLLVRRPLALLGLGPALTDVERSVRESVSPANRSSQDHFDDYHIIDTLTSGGSGASLYVAEPVSHRRRRLAGRPDRVVIKCFDLDGGSSLPQMMRESRSLDAARRIGLVLEHGMDDARFWYVMPWIPGSHLGDVVTGLHTGEQGLDGEGLSQVFAVMLDLLKTLRQYHRQGLWHKDVKPENIIVNDAGAHLVDLGLVTPLASAMTLTTHGTEYFRDPELVRQALRGAKVSDVDGARFDVYAAGAVLYYMLENTFPAHGGLSRFDQASPEAAQWIVHRAMSDYDNRYGTIGDMLEDVAVLVQAEDPWTVRPADLPSMSGTTENTTTPVEPTVRRTVPRRAIQPVAPPPTRRTSPGGRFAWASAMASFVLGILILVLVVRMLRGLDTEMVAPFNDPVAIAESIEVPSPASSRPGLCLVVIDHAARDVAPVSTTIDDFRDDLARAGWTQRVDVEAEIAVRSVMSPYVSEGRVAVHPAVRRALQERDLDAAAILVASSDDALGVDVVLLTREWQARWSLPRFSEDAPAGNQEDGD